MVSPDEFAGEITAALGRLRPVVRRTPCVPVGGAGGCDAWFKLENTQLTGSFKIRGAYHRIAADPQARAGGVVMASSGNHGRAVAFVARRLGVRAAVCVPDRVDPVKRAALEAAGAEIVLSGPTYEDAWARAVELAERTGATFVHPFDDERVIAGQATLGVEPAEQLPAHVRTGYVPVSGGGLAAGVALGLRHAGQAARVVGVCAESAPSMRASVLAGRPVEVTERPTVASALSGGIGMANRLTLGLVRALLAEVVAVSEAEIVAGMPFAAMEAHQVVEGGGATPVAAWLRARAGDEACVLSGGNIDSALLAGVLAPDADARPGRPGRASGGTSD